MLCKVSGWGTTKSKDASDLFFYSQMELATYTQSAYVPITEMGACAEGYKSITRRQFCAGFVEGGKDACQVFYSPYCTVKSLSSGRRLYFWRYEEA